MKKLDLRKDEAQILEEIERDEWKSAVRSPGDLDVFRNAARQTLKKEKRVNIRISERDLTRLQKVAAEEGIPYQTLISSILHKYVDKKLEV